MSIQPEMITMSYSLVGDIEEVINFTHKNQTKH